MMSKMSLGSGSVCDLSVKSIVFNYSLPTTEYTSKRPIKAIFQLFSIIFFLENLCLTWKKVQIPALTNSLSKLNFFPATILLRSKNKKTKIAEASSGEYDGSGSNTSPFRAILP